MKLFFVVLMTTVLSSAGAGAGEFELFGLKLGMSRKQVQAVSDTSRSFVLIEPEAGYSECKLIGVAAPKEAGGLMLGKFAVGFDDGKLTGIYFQSPYYTDSKDCIIWVERFIEYAGRVYGEPVQYDKRTARQVGISRKYDLVQYMGTWETEGKPKSILSVAVDAEGDEVCCVVAVLDAAYNN